MLTFCLWVSLPMSALAETNPLGRTKTGDIGDALEFALPTIVIAATLAKRDMQGAKEFGLGLLTTIGTTYALKESISKERPDGRDDDSFPSSHTAVSFHAAGYVHERYGWKWSLPVYIAATWVGHSRIHDDRHDEQDVIAGAAIGYLAARFFTTQYQGVKVTPAISKELVGLNLSYRF